MNEGQIAYWTAVGIGSVLIGWHVRSFIKMALVGLLWACLIFLLGKAAGVI